MADHPRRLRPSTEKREATSRTTHTSLSGDGSVGAARPIPNAEPRGRRYNPPLWKETYSVPGSLALLPGKTRTYNREGYALAIVSVAASVNTAPVGADVVIDVLKNGASIYTTTANRPTIAAGTNDVLAALPDDLIILDGDYLTIDIVQVGSTTAGADLTVQVRAL